mgnify:CR=1 FL=1
MAASHGLGFLRLVLLATMGRKFWILPLLPLLWLVFQGILRLLDNGSGGFLPEHAQGTLIGVPLTALAVFLGMRIIAGEIEDRSLEIAYTVPGGVQRLWFAKLAAAGALLLVSLALLAAGALFFTTYPPSALYGAFQPAAFYLVFSMAMGALFRNEIAGAIATVALLGFNGLITDFGQSPVRISPFWNPDVLKDADNAELLAWTIQNRIGIVLAIIAITSLAFMRANRRERMLGS